jgi:hypothetical protein
MDINRSQIEDNNDNENNDDNDDEEKENNEMIINDDIIPPAILLNENRPRRNAVRPERFRETPPNQNIVSVPLNNRQKKAINSSVIPNVPVVNIMQRRSNSILAVQNHILNINVNYQINVNDIEEDIDVPPVARLRVDPVARLRVEPNIDEIQPYVENPLRRVNALLAINNLMNNERRNGLTLLQARDKLKSDLLLAGTGVVPDTLLIDQTAMQTAMNNFINKINTTKLESCSYCVERWFNDGGKRIDVDTYVCKECLPAYNQCKKNETQYIAKMSQDNNMDPYYHPDPLAMAEYNHLITHHKLTKIECALISRQKVIMKVYKLVGPHGGSNLGFSGNTVNILQDLDPLCRVFPRLLSDSGFFTVRAKRGEAPNDFKDFKVKRNSIYLWLMFLKKWNKAYKDIDISEINLNLLPIDASVFDQLPIIEEEQINENAIENNPLDPNEINNAPNVNDDEDEGGVEDGPVNDIDIDEDNILETSIGGKPVNNDEAEDIIDVILQPIVPRYDNVNHIQPVEYIDANLVPNVPPIIRAPVPINANIVPNILPIVPEPIPMDENIIRNVLPIFAINEPIPWPAPGENAIDEFNTPYFFSLMNPYLLPFGTGDCTDKIRLYDVTLHESAKHYQRYALYDPILNYWRWPFAENHAFMHCIQDMDERRRIQSQASIFLEQNPSTANLTIEGLRETARAANSHSSFVIDQKMQRYGANILGM